MKHEKDRLGPAGRFEGGRRIHMSVSREYVILAIKKIGAKKALHDFDGTDEEALAAAEDGPDVYVIGECDNQKDGRCLGHPMMEDER